MAYSLVMELPFPSKDSFQTLNFPRVHLLTLKAADQRCWHLLHLKGDSAVVAKDTPQGGWWNLLFGILTKFFFFFF